MFTFQACCKINLGLKVTGCRPDGYHNLQTILYPVPLCDDITVEESETDILTLTGIPVGGIPGDNLVLRAVRMLRDKGFAIPHLHIRLHKNIPNGAGLGGGSSDAAGMVRELNRHCALGMSDEEMERSVVPLGADCPFFVRCKPVYAQGTGNVFSPANVNLGGMHILLVKPQESVSTREAYAMTQPRMPETPLAKLVQHPIGEWRELVSNDFERSIFPTHPVIREIKEQLYAMGAAYASMSGSGSCVFGLFQGKPVTSGLFEGMFVYVAQL